MTDTTKPTFRLTAHQYVQDGQYAFAVEAAKISSGPCRTQQEALDTVFRQIRTWAQSLTPDIRALTGVETTVAPTAAATAPASIPSQYQRLEYVREIRLGAGAPILQRLVEKYGQKSNTELAEAIGLVGEYKANGSTFSNALAGRGSRFIRCAIAMALDEPPSQVWPFLSLKVRIADDEVYFKAKAGQS